MLSCCAVIGAAEGLIEWKSAHEVEEWQPLTVGRTAVNLLWIRAALDCVAEPLPLF